MAKVGAQRAAELTGKSKSTIQRAMNSGKISYEKDSNGRRVIDVSELERAFGLKSDERGQASQTAVAMELKQASDMLETERMKMRIKMLEEQLDLAKEREEDLREQRDQWQRQAQQVLITSQYSQKQAEELKEEVKELGRREEERRRKALEARMKRAGAGAGNQNREGAPASARPMTAPEADAVEKSGFDFQGLWQKIKGEAATG